MKKTSCILLLFTLCFLPAVYAKSITDKTSGMEKHPGFLTYYWDAANGKIWLEIDRWNQEFLYLDSLPAGIGSNDIGLDRGQMGESRVVKFFRSGSRVLLMQSNYGYRALTDDSQERQAVEESFAQSVLWGFVVEAQEGERVLVDATDFYLQDAHHVTVVLRDTKQGNYKIDSTRCAIFLPDTRNFPQNTEVDAILTFVTPDNPGELARSVAPNARSITVREHHSFVQLPDSGYKPREFDPRCGFFAIDFMDYASPVGDPVRKRWIVRHRLQKKDPSAAVSDAVRPLIYYVDPGAPEPVRSALIEGASWWNQAFEAAGYRNAFQVKVLPPDADPMDVRYNMIEWIHRSTRGWSYGNTVIDPRTGEVIKGHVSLGSLRVRQDYMIAEGLLAPYEDGENVPPEMLKMALARIRQLAAHEVGHTLGLSHNYIASTADRASVMDYPAPLVQIGKDGTLDLSNAYGVGIGEWDKVTIAYGYQDFPQGTDETSKLNSTLTEAMARGLIFLTDQDARPPGSAQPKTHLWDNGTNAVDELAHILEVRRLALKRFSEKNIREGAPLATLEEVLVPIYLYHRYQTDAVAKVIGGVDYKYAVRGDSQIPVAIVAPEEQRRALDALLKTLSTDVLSVPESIVRLIPPHPAGYDRTNEVFKLRTGLTFDPLSAAESAADMTVSILLNRERAARLVEHHALDSAQPSLHEVIGKLLSATWKSARTTGYKAEISRATDGVVLSRLMGLAADTEASNESRAVVTAEIDSLRLWIAGRVPAVSDPEEKAHLQYGLFQIKLFQDDPRKMNLTPPPNPPAGPPIGDYD